MKRQLLGGLAAAALVGSGLAMSSASTVTVGKSPDAKCKPGAAAPANFRVAKGTSKWREPNTLTRKQAAAMEARTAAFLKNHNISTSARPAGSVKIPVRFHVITERDGDGNVSNTRIQRQIKVLNDSFAGRTGGKAANTPFRFRLKSVERIKNNDWYHMNYRDSVQAKRALRMGDARTLNIYTADTDGNLDGVLGYATFPEDYKKHPRLDGVVLLNGTVPGGNANYGPGAVYNQGDTATHEVGHWMNLYHTFQGGCSEPNDYVVDTPWQRDADNIFLCARQDTCGGVDSRRDPVHNFMNYVDDPCMYKFTRGQKDRMNTSWYIRQALSD